MNIQNEVHGDENEIAAEARRCAEEWEAEHADDWKYSEERLTFMTTNKFDIGQRVWHVHYESHGFSVLKCLVIAIESNLTDLGKSGVVEWAINTIRYKLYPISKLNREEYLCEDSSVLKSSARRMFDEKEDAFHFLDTCIMSQRKALEDEF